MTTQKTVISEEDTIYNIVTQNPELKEVLLSLSPRFEKLQNSAMFQTVARVTSVRQAAKVGGVYLKEMLYQLNDAIGLGEEYFAEQKKKVAGLRESFLKTYDSGKEDRPEWLTLSRNWSTEDLRLQEGDPFDIINQWTDGLTQGQGIILIQKFEPIPLLKYLKLKGFVSYIDKINSEEYNIYLYKQEGE